MAMDGGGAALKPITELHDVGLRGHRVLPATFGPLRTDYNMPFLATCRAFIAINLIVLVIVMRGELPQLQTTAALRRRDRDGGSRLRLIVCNHSQNHHLLLILIRQLLLRRTGTTTLINANENLLLQKVA